MTKALALMVVLVLTVVCGLSQTGKPTGTDGPVKVTLKTVGRLLDGPTSQYKVGDQIVVTVTMTNTSTVPQNVCLSSGLYQNVPQLTRDNVALPYMEWQSYEIQNAQHNRTCQEINLPEPVVLQPNQARVLDYFVVVDSRIATGADAWYERLGPGKYEISLQRRLGCCDGPMVQSNKVSFEVVE
jgi:hypothetical protein